MRYKPNARKSGVDSTFSILVERTKAEPKAALEQNGGD
jgi:hypothetical protein